MTTLKGGATLDYVARQKTGGTNFNFFIVKQLPVPSPSIFTLKDIEFVGDRVLELVYTAWDIKPFVDDVWAELDAAGRERVRRRWHECNGQ